MTVSALWSVLAGTGSGRSIGLQEFIAPHHPSSEGGIDSSTVGNGRQPPLQQHRPPKALAVDLSIWICEALTSTVLGNFHANPAVHLVYQRTVALLKLGLKLIFVVEGERRSFVFGATDNSDNISARRRGGSNFFRACRSCEELLGFLGVPVVRARCEGEALCALLNQRGIVDGVISNDGDCLLFGATTVYTDFTLQNLEHNQVMRYDSSNLRAMVEDDADGASGGSSESITLDRDDLIAFAILTGSDIAGDGIPHVGPKKAIKFIQACRRSHPLHLQGYQGRPAIDVLQRWDSAARNEAAAAAANAAAGGDEAKAKERCCSLCLHPGNKRDHEKHGCTECGTDAGEACFAVSTEERFKLAVRAKALSMTPTFASRPIIDAYRSPNRSIIPYTTKGISLSASSGLPMEMPRYHDIIRSTTLSFVKGNTISSSQEHLQQTLPRLLARLHILAKAQSNLPENRYKNSASNRTSGTSTMPVPERITRRATNTDRACYEISWRFGELSFVTQEWQCIIDSKLSMLVDQFHHDERRAAQARNAEQRRAMFGVGGAGGGGKQGGNGMNGQRGYQEGLNNRAGAKRRAAVQGGNGGGGRSKKGAGGARRERAFGAGVGMGTHAELPKGGGDDFTFITRFTMNQSTLDDRDDSDRDQEMALASHQKDDDGWRGSCSSLSAGDFDDIENGVGGATAAAAVPTVADATESHIPREAVHKDVLYTPPVRDNKEALSVATDAEEGHHESSNKEVLVRGGFATPNVYQHGQLANPRVFRGLSEKKENDSVYQTPQRYAFGQLANPTFKRKFAASAPPKRGQNEKCTTNDQCAIA